LAGKSVPELVIGHNQIDLIALGHGAPWDRALLEEQS
jgi:hypothetical protein